MIMPRHRTSVHSVCLLLLLMGCHGSAVAQTKSTDDDPQVVRMIIDYNDGCQKHFTAIVWRKEMTVLDVLRAAERHPRGIRARVRGKDSTAFLTEMDGLKNGQANGRNWIYRVNGKLGDQGIGKRIVSRGDTVLWKFDTYN